jgi:hypothetical protein
MPGDSAGSAAAAVRPAGRDLIVALLLFSTAVGYVATLPWNLYPADEATYLLEAKRVLDGEVMYRDVFDFITPGYQYLMALAFGLFGATIGTARVTIAVVQGLIAVTIYATCRRLGVRSSLSLAAGLTHLTVGHGAWSIASQHWLSTLLSTLVLWIYAGRVETLAPVARGALILGLLVMVQQQRGVPIVAGAAAWLIVDALLARRYGRPISVRALAARLGVFAAVIALVAVPVLGWCVARAGFAAVWYALVEFPLFKYRPTASCRWGATFVAAAMPFTFPRLLAWLPIVFALTLPRLCWLVIAGYEERTARQLVWLVMFAVSSMISIMYFPDFVHIAFIAPVFYVLLAENTEFAARKLRRLGPAAALAATAVVLLLSSGFLARTWLRLWEQFPIAVDSAFGRVQLASPEPGLMKAFRRLAEATTSREVYIRPALGSFYLMSGAKNPTPHCLYTASLEQADVITWLEARRPVYAVQLDEGEVGLVADYLRRTYEPMTVEPWLQGKILRRRTEGDGGATP